MRYKIILSSVVIASFVLGCGGGSSSSNETNSTTDDSLSKRQITVERGPVFGALVKDAKGQIATNSKANVYIFKTNPYYPITVSNNPNGGTFIDVDGDGKKSNDDIGLNIDLKSCSNIVTPISTYVYSKSNCINEQLKETYQNLNLQLHVSEDELKKLPSKMKDTEAIIASNATYIEMVKNPNKTVEISQIKSQSETIKTYIGDDKNATSIEKVVIGKNEDVLKPEVNTGLIKADGYLKFTKNYLVGKTFYDVYDDDGKWVIVTFSFDQQNIHISGRPTRTYEISDKGYIQFASADYTNKTELIKAFSKDDDKISIVWTDEYKTMEDFEKLTPDEYLFFNKNKAIEFVKNKNNQTTQPTEPTDNNKTSQPTKPTQLVNKFEVGKKYYVFENDRTYIKGLHIKDSSDWVETEFHFNASTKQWNSNPSQEANEDYALVNGQWKPEGEIPHVLNSDGTVSWYIEKYTLKNATAIQGKQNIMFNGKNIEVDFPTGSISYTNNITNASSELGYGIWVGNGVNRGQNFKEFITQYCGTSMFISDTNKATGYRIGLSFAGTKMSDGKYKCITDATSGNIFEVAYEKTVLYPGTENEQIRDGNKVQQRIGTWDIKQIQGIDMLFINVDNMPKYDPWDNIKKFYTVYNGKVRDDWLFSNGEEENEIVYNETAINAIKEAIAK